MWMTGGGQAFGLPYHTAKNHAFDTQQSRPVHFIDVLLVRGRCHGGDPTSFFEFELNSCALVMGTATFRLPRVWPVQYDENDISGQIAEPLCLLPLSAKTSAMRFELRQEHHRVARFIIAVYIISGGCRDPHPPSSLSCVPPRHKTMDLRSYFQWHHKRHPVLPLSQHTKSSCDSRKVHLVPAMRCVQMASWKKPAKVKQASAQFLGPRLASVVVRVACGV